MAIILPASTFPLDVVQADRFLQKVKQDKNLKPDQRWDESIRNLLNYPEVISMMSQDLDWTQDLGEAVVSQQADVIKAIQAFRAKAQTAGNLKSDDKQIIVEENNTIQIVPADPEVIYVPQYQPSTVVVQQPAPVYSYYPTPYPVYYYPYPPGYTFAAGFFWGAATAYAFNWGHGDINYNVNISDNDSIKIDRGDKNNQQKVGNARKQAKTRPATTGQGGRQSWRSSSKPGQISRGRVSPGTRPSARPGDAGFGRGVGKAGRGDHLSPIVVEGLDLAQAAYGDGPRSRDHEDAVALPVDRIVEDKLPAFDGAALFVPTTSSCCSRPVGESFGRAQEHSTHPIAPLANRSVANSVSATPRCARSRLVATAWTWVTRPPSQRRMSRSWVAWWSVAGTTAAA